MDFETFNIKQVASQPVWVAEDVETTSDVGLLPELKFEVVLIYIFHFTEKCKSTP
jgi:hypothetical protein